jgi:hypothetical protein
MLCSFVKTPKEFICENCGRRVKLDSNIKNPTAQCRIKQKIKLVTTPQYQHQPVIFKTGVGTILENLFKKIGINHVQQCDCSSKFHLLNKKGIIWCETNIETILQWIKAESKEQNIPFAPKTARALVRLAIKKAKLVV